MLLFLSSPFGNNMEYCDELHMVSHVTVTTTSVSQVTGEEILTCFEIMHLKMIEICGTGGNWMEIP